MNQQHETESAMAEREIVSSRLINASQQKVFEAFRNPEILARWWGPAGFTNTFHSFELQPGGTWEFIMHGPDGTDYPNKNVFAEVVEPERVVFDHIYPPVFRMILTCEPTAQANQTRFGFRMQFESAAVCQQLKSMCVPANEQNFDRLEAVLTEI